MKQFRKASGLRRGVGILCVSPCAALLCLSGTASAQQTFNFVNTCGTGIWNTACNPSEGLWQNNWGNSAATSAALVFPGTLDTANILAGSNVTLSNSVSVATLNIAPGATMNWDSGAITTPLAGTGVGLVNQGLIIRSTTNAGSIVGNFVNATGAEIRFARSGFGIGVNAATSWTNDGTILFVDGTGTLGLPSSVVRTLANNGTIAFAGPANGLGVSLRGWTVITSAPQGRWTTTPDATWRVSGNLSGTFVGRHEGEATVSNLTLVGDTTLALTPDSPNPWRGTSPSVNTGAFTLTNASRIEWGDPTNSGGSFSGNFVNAAGASFTITNFGFQGMSVSNATNWTNNGLMTFVVPGSTGGSGLLQGTMRNNGTVSFSSPLNPQNQNPSAIRGFRVIESSPAALWTTAQSARWDIGGGLSGTFVGDHLGTAQWASDITLFGDTTFALLPASQRAWRWSDGLVDTGLFTLTNLSRMDWTSSSFGRRFRGMLVNAPGASISLASAVTLSGPSTWQNDGTMTFVGATSIGNATTGPAAARSLVNNGRINLTLGGFTGPVSLWGLTELRQSPAGVISLQPQTELRLEIAPSWPFAAGRIEGLGTLRNIAGITISGTPGTNPPATLARGVIAPGLSDGSSASDIGTLTINTTRLIMTADGELELTIRNVAGSSTPSDQTVDRLQIVDPQSTTPPDAQHTLGGVLRIRRALGTTELQSGIDHVIVDVSGGGSPNLSGTFDQIIDADPLPGVRYDVRTTPTQAILRVVRACGSADVAGPNQQPLFDGYLTADDIIVFLGWFFAGDVRADVGGPNQSTSPDDALTADDVMVFLNRYFAGC